MVHVWAAAVHAKKAGQVPKAARMTVVPTATMLETLAEVRTFPLPQQRELHAWRACE